tara:strand:+ start:265 stop:555 length:291 start_codon:yes stop_codon:yes gene_type:complete
MESSKPIYKISKELGFDTNKIILACKTLGINAKGSSKRLNSEELEKIIDYFNSGKNVCTETIEIGNKISEKVNKKNTIKKDSQDKENIYFPNRLIG